MFGRRTKAAAEETAPSELKDAVREARIEAAERSAVIVDLRDAELARLELLNEALEPVFKDVPADTMKGVRVLFIGDAADDPRVKAAVSPAGVDYVFIEAK